MSVYLNRFLNVPPARLPEPNQTVDDPEQLLSELPQLLDRQQQVNEAGASVARYLYSGGNPEKLLALLTFHGMWKGKNGSRVQMANHRNF